MLVCIWVYMSLFNYRTNMCMIHFMFHWNLWKENEFLFPESMYLLMPNPCDKLQEQTMTFRLYVCNHSELTVLPWKQIKALLFFSSRFCMFKKLGSCKWLTLCLFLFDYFKPCGLDFWLGDASLEYSLAPWCSSVIPGVMSDSV